MWKRFRKFTKRRILADSSVSDNERRLWFVFFVIVGMTYASLLIEHGQRLWTRDYFQFYPVFVAGVLYLTFQRFREGVLPPKRSWRIEPVSMFVGLAIVPLALWITSPLLAAASFLLVGNSLLCGNRSARQAWRLLVLLIPLPFGRDRWFVQELQQISSAKASVLLDVVGVPHLMRGNVLELTDKHFFVEEACSGISSVYLILATTWFCLVWYQARAIRAVPLLLSVFWWAMIANVLRIFGIASAHFFWKIDLSTGVFHELTGVAVLAFAFGMVYLTKIFLDFIFDAIGDGSVIRDNKVSLELTPTVIWNLFTVRDLTVAHGTRPTPPLGINVHRRLMLLSISGFLLISATARLGYAYFPEVFQGSASTPDSSVNRLADDMERLKRFDAELFSGFSGVQGVKFGRENPTDGVDVVGKAKTCVWVLERETGTVTVTLTGPRDAWRDPRTSYLDDGWKVADAAIASIRPTSKSNLIILQLMNSDGQSVSVYDSHFYSTGELMQLPEPESGEIFGDVRHRLQSLSTGIKGGAAWQFRMEVPHSGPMIDATAESGKRFFEQLLWHVLDHWRQTQ